MSTCRVDDRDVEVSDFFTAITGDYTVYKNKIWRITAYEQLTPRRAVKTLTREKTKESITTYTNQIKLLRVDKPSGYISI